MSTNRISVCAFEHLPLQFLFRTARLARFDSVTDPDDHNEGAEGGGHPIGKMQRKHRWTHPNRQTDLPATFPRADNCKPSLPRNARAWYRVDRLIHLSEVELGEGP